MGEWASGIGMASLMVLDTDVLIDHFRGLREATLWIHALPVGRRAVTDVTVMELFRGATNRQELDAIDRFLDHNLFVRLPITTWASRRAVELVRQYGLSHGLRMPDALIASIVLESGSEFYTGNLRHFEFIEGLHEQRPPYRP